MATPFKNECWWEESKNKSHDALASLVHFLDDNQPHHKTDAIRHMRLYGNLDVGLGPFRYNRSQSNNATNRVTLNVIKSCCDTLTAKIAKNKPRPLFLTSGGDFSAQRRAKMMTKYVDGVFYATDAYAIAQKCFLDAAVWGTGIMAVYRDDDKIKLERVMPTEICVDDVEGLYGKPGNLYRRKYIPRTLALRLFPKKKTDILAANQIESDEGTGNGIADMIEVREAWHLASKEGATDGRYVVAIDGATLVDEVYTHDYFPFVFLRLGEKLAGFWGCGIAEQLVGTQLEINKLLRNITSQINLLSAPKVLLEVGSKVVSSHMTNEIGTILNYVGQKPDLWLPQTVHPEIFQHLERLVRFAYEITGVSQMSASSQKPAGLESGKAIREFNDIESERFVVVGQQWERFFVQLAQRVIALTREIYKDSNGELSVTLQSKKFIRKIDWSDASLEEDEYVMQIFPSSALPNSPAGRLASIQELIAAGFIGPEEGIKLLDFPDLESANNLLTAALEDIDMTIELMIDEMIYNPPEPMQNLELGLKRFQSAYLRARVDGVPEERLELLRRWMLDAQAMLNVGQDTAPAMAETVTANPEAQERVAAPTAPEAQGGQGLPNAGAQPMMA